MYMFAKSNANLTMKITIFQLLVILVAFTACSGESSSPESAVICSFSEAMSAIESDDFEGYVDRSDFGSDMDSVQRAFLCLALKQHKLKQTEKMGGTGSMSVVEVKFLSDSLCDVFYQLIYADSTKEVSSQRMIKVGDEWKIRLRN